ncbi:MAG: GtrA family protein [Actinobacteria bacterium]|nr:GtrA family protein [Actinomycetota bacterium]
MISYLRSFFNRAGVEQMIKLALIGVVNTGVYFAMLNILISLSVPLFWRVTISFAVATEVSYLLNRRWTFRLKGGIGPWRETAVFFVVNGLAWGVTLAIVLGADALFGPLSRLGENLANLAAGILILLPKLASYRDLVFRRSLESRRPAAAPEGGAEPEAGGVPPHLPERSHGDSAG